MARPCLSDLFEDNISSMISTKLDALLSIRGILTNSMTLSKNSLTAIDSIHLSDNDSNDIYQRINFFLKSRHERDVLESQKLLDDLNYLIDKSCNHSFVEDEIENIYTGDLIKIRYCSICEKTA